MTDLQAIRRAIDPQARQAGDVRCPAHDDRQASLAVSLNKDGKLLCHCHAGCSQESVWSAVRVKAGHVLNGYATAAQAPQRARAPSKDLTISGSQPIKVWDYQDRDGRVVCKVARYQSPAGKTFRPWVPDRDGWKCEAMPAPRILYRLPALLADTDAIVVVTEGEKAADAAQAMLGDHYVATTWAGGASNPDYADWKPLQGRDVIVWPDNDDPGRDASKTVCDSLAGIAASIRVVRVDDLPHKADAADVTWTPDKLLERCGEDISTQASSAAPTSSVSAEAPTELEARVWHLPENWLETCPPPRPFVLHPYIPRRAVSALLGAGTASKTLLEVEWIAAITTGSDWRGHSVQEGDVVVLSWEDEGADYHAKLFSLVHARPDLQPFADQIRQRLHIIDLKDPKYRLVANDERNRPMPTLLAHNVVELVQRLFPDTVQVFVETLSRSNGSDESNEAMAAVVAAGEVIAIGLDAGVTVVHHVSKAAAGAGVIDAGAGRGGSALPDNSRASTVVALVGAESPKGLWPEGFTEPSDFTDREIVVIENARSSYGRKATRMHLERVYPETGAPYLRSVAPVSPLSKDKPDTDALVLMGWLRDNLASDGLTADGIAQRRGEYHLSERYARSALERLVKAGGIAKRNERQYGNSGRMVTRYRLAERLTNDV